MLRKLAILVALVAVQYAFAADAVKPKTGSIQGTVADAINGQPLANVSITLSPVRRYTTLNTEGSNSALATTSDPNGQFTLDTVPTGDYFLVAKKAGFIDRLYGAHIHSNAGIQLSVHAGEAVKDIAINMLRGAVIAGTVVNEDGEPFARVHIRALQYQFSRQGKRLAIVDSTVTDDHGNYRIHGLMPGSYIIACASGRDHPLKENGTTSIGHYPVTFYPSVTSLDNAVAIPVKVGDEAVVNVTLTATRGYAIRGKIAGSDPGSKVTAQMSPVLSSGATPLVIQVADDGSFEVRGVPPGNYHIGAQGAVSKSTATVVRKITIEDRDLNDVLIMLENSRPLIGGTVWLNGRADKTRLLVRLLPAASDYGDDEDSIVGTDTKVRNGSPIPDLSGRFTAAELDREAARVFATIEPQSQGYEDWYVASVLRNNEDVTNSGFDPKSGGQLAITLNNDGAMLQGTVIAHDGQAVPGSHSSVSS